MGFQVADLFVNISVRGLKATQNSIGSLRATLGAFSGVVGGLQLMSAAYLATFSGAIAVVTRSVMDSETATRNLETALSQLNQNTAENRDEFIKFADDMQQKTVYSRTQILNLIDTAAKLGTKFKDLKTVTNAGIGLGEMFYGGDAEKGVEAISLAQKGNFEGLKRMMPILHMVYNKQVALNLVLEQARRGLDFANTRALTLSGALQRMKNAITDAGESFGNILLPQLKSAVEFVHKVAVMLKEATPAQKEYIIHIAKIAAGFGALIMLGPTVLAFFVSVARAAIGTVTTIAQSFIFLITNPIGWLITALAGVAIGFAYLVGAGKTATERVGNGFLQIAEFLDPMLGSFEGLGLGIKMVWDNVISHVTDIVIAAKSVILNIWEHLAEGIEQEQWSLAKDYAVTYQKIKGITANSLEWIRHAWEEAANWIGGKIASVYERYQVAQDVNKRMPNASQEERSAATDKEMAVRQAYLDKQTTSANRKEDNQHNIRLRQIEREKNDNIISIDDQATAQAAADKQRREGNRQANDDEAQKLISMNKQQRDADWAQGQERLKQLPKLSAEVMALYKKVKAGMGVDDLQKEFSELAKKFNSLKVNPGQLDSKMDLSLREEMPQMHFTGLQEAFKKTLAWVMVGEGLQNKEQQARQQAQEIRKQTLLEHKKTNAKLDTMNELMQNITAGGMVQ